MVYHTRLHDCGSKISAVDGIHDAGRWLLKMADRSPGFNLAVRLTDEFYVQVLRWPLTKKAVLKSEQP